MADSDKRLRELYARLPEDKRRTLLEFAEFLAAGTDLSKPEPERPQDIPRPENETVVAAIQRLSNTYPMLDKRHLLNETSALMAQHVVEGREAHEVIEELETVFENQYKKHYASETD